MESSERMGTDRTVYILYGLELEPLVLVRVCPSGCPGLHVAQHGFEALHAGCVGVGQLVGQAAVQAEGLELQPDEAKSVLVNQDEQTGRALRAGEAVTCDQAGPIETWKRGTKENN